MKTPSQVLGALGEKLARERLSHQGYKILTRNYDCGLGEIDIIARHKDYLVFIEVKTRFSDEMGHPAEAVTADKRRQIIKAAQFYLKQYTLHDFPCRFDVVSVQMGEGEPVLEVIENAFGE